MRVYYALCVPSSEVVVVEILALLYACQMMEVETIGSRAAVLFVDQT